jgi:hypothetical protein
VLCAEAGHLGQQVSARRDEATVVRDRVDHIAQALRRRGVPPRHHGNVGGLVEGEIDGGDGTRSPQQPPRVGVMGIVGVLAGQQDAGIDQPAVHAAGRWRLTKSETPPP